MPVNAHPASQHGIDRASLPLSLRLIRGGFGVLRRISRRAAVRLAARLFARPRRHRRPAREKVVLERAVRSTVRQGDRDIAVYTWLPSAAHGDAAPARTALLVHGWEGRGSQLGAFVGPLLERGFRVVAFDHVGHGESDGRRCSLPTMRDTLRAVAEAALARGGSGSNGGPDAVVAHSMGSLATSLLLADGWRATAAVYVAPPDDLTVYLARYLELVTGSDDLFPDLIAHWEERFGESAEDFDFRHLVETLDQPLLVFHSDDDRDVPIERGRFVAEHWPGALIRTLTGLGHRRILWNEGVAAAAAEFLDGVCVRSRE